MSQGAELFVVAMHVVALGMAAGLLLLLFRSNTETELPPGGEADDGRGGMKPLVPPSGPPLPDAMPAGVRMREPGRLAERSRRPARRSPHEPAAPTRVPARR